MLCAPDYTTKFTAAVPAAGVVMARTLTGASLGFTTNFATDRNHPLAERRTG